MSQFGVRRSVEHLPTPPEWAKQLRRRTVRSVDELSEISAQVKNDLPKLAVLPKVWCLCVFSIVVMLVFLLTLQYAGLVEVQYELDRAQHKLAALDKQKNKVALQVEELSSLKRISEQAKLLGMESPQADKVHIVQLSSVGSGQKVSVFYYPPAKKDKLSAR
ncbi:MAG: septum formation initiator family protein [Candidatus Bruticola sp.]